LPVKGINLLLLIKLTIIIKNFGILPLWAIIEQTGLIFPQIWDWEYKGSINEQ